MLRWRESEQSCSAWTPTGRACPAPKGGDLAQRSADDHGRGVLHTHVVIVTVHAIMDGSSDRFPDTPLHPLPHPLWHKGPANGLPTASAEGSATRSPAHTSHPSRSLLVRSGWTSPDHQRTAAKGPTRSLVITRHTSHGAFQPPQNRAGSPTPAVPTTPVAFFLLVCSRARPDACCSLRAVGVCAPCLARALQPLASLRDDCS